MAKTIKKDPKTIFHTTEKSNFILNMTEEQYSRLASWGLVIGMFLMPLFTIFPEINDYKFSYAMTAGGLAVAGVINMILAIIAIMKKYVPKAAMLPVCAFGAMTAWGIISLINGYDLGVGFYGFTERCEGLLAIAFYGCFFITAITIKRRSAVKRVINGVIAVGVLNSIISLIQIFTANLTHYDYVGWKRGGDHIFLNAASGLSMSPLFLAMLLTLSLTAALIAFVNTDSKRGRLIYLVVAALFSFVMMFTYSLLGLCGAVFALIAAAVAVFMLKAPKLRLIILPVSVAFAGLAVCLINTGVVKTTDSYKLYDGRIAWYADGYMRTGASGPVDESVLDIDDTSTFYWYTIDKTMNIIGENKLVGTGPEQLAYPQLKSAAGYAAVIDMIHDPKNRMVFDKVYDEYLYTAATRGIPSLIALIMILAPVLVIGAKAARKKKYAEIPVLFAMTLGGVLLFFIGCSSIAYAPVFWAVAGASCAEFENDAAPAAGNTNNKNSREESEEPEKVETKTANTIKKGGRKSNKKQ